MKEAPSSHLQESSNTIPSELIDAKSSEGQSKGDEVAETTSNNHEGENGSSVNHNAPCRVQSFLGDCALEDLEYEKNEATNAAPSKVVLKVQSSPVRRRLSSQVRVAIDDTIERLLKFEEDDKGGVSVSEGNGEGNMDNGNNAAKTAPVHGQPSSQVSIAIDDTIKRILFLEVDDKVEASATEDKEEGTIESGNITAKTGSTHRRPSSQMRMAIDDSIEQLLIFEIHETETSAATAKGEGNVDNGNITTKTATPQRRPSSQISMATDDTIMRILFSEDEEDIVPSGTNATEGRDVLHEDMVAKIVPIILTDDIIRTHDNSHTCRKDFTLHVTPALGPTEENKTSDGGKSDSDEGLKAPNVSSPQLNSSALTTDAHIAAEMFIQEVSTVLQIPERSKMEKHCNVAFDENHDAPFVSSALLGSSTHISDAHIATEEFIQAATLALEIPEKSKVEDGTNVVADGNSETPFVPFAPLASSTCISDAHIATEEFIQAATLALEIPEKSKVEDGTNVVADGNSETPFVPFAPLASSTHISDAHIATEEFIQAATLALEIPEKSKVEDGTNVVADENSETPFVPFAPLASSTHISDAHIAREEFIQETKLALEIPEKSKVEDGTNVVADENSETPFVPFAPLASPACISDAHIATEEFIQEATLALKMLEDGTSVVANENSETPFVPFAPLASSTCMSGAHTATEEFIQEATLALEIPEKSKIEDGTNVVADENSEASFVPSAPLASSTCFSEAHIATEDFIQEATLALELPERGKLGESNNVAADEKCESPRVPSALLDSSTVASTAHIPSAVKGEGSFKVDECVVHDEKTEASCRSSLRTNN